MDAVAVQVRLEGKIPMSKLFIRREGERHYRTVGSVPEAVSQEGLIASRDSFFWVELEWNSVTCPGGGTYRGIRKLRLGDEESASIVRDGLPPGCWVRELLRADDSGDELTLVAGVPTSSGKINFEIWRASGTKAERASVLAWVEF